MRNSNVSKRLSILIRSLKMSRKEFATQTGIDVSVICRILKGEIEPSLRSLEKIANATKVSPSWLMGYGNDEEIERM